MMRHDEMEGDGGRENEKTKTPMPPRYMYNCRTDRVRGILTKKGKWEWGGYHSNSQKREERFEKQKKMEMYRSHPRALWTRLMVQSKTKLMAF
jgi:hypothetical protein